MAETVNIALQLWERALQELRRVEAEWRSLSPWAPGRDALRLRCELLAVDADALFDAVLQVLREQPAVTAAPAA